MNKIFLAAALLVPAAAFANGYHLPISSPRDLAFGGSGTVAIQNSASAVYANPAALAGLDGLNLAGSLELITLSATWKDPTPGSTQGDVSSIPKAAFPPAAYISYGDRLGGMPVAIGAGFTVAGGGLFYWPTNWPGRAQVVTVDRKTLATDVAVAIQPIDMLKIGIGGTYIRTQEKLQQILPFGDQAGDVQLGTAGGAFTFHVGGELQPLPGWKIGVDYRHKADQTLTGDAHFGHIPDTFANQLRDQGASHDITWPNVLQGGTSYQVTPDLLVNVGVLFVRWIVYKEDRFVGDQGLVVQVPHNFTNGFGVSVGAEYMLPMVKGLALRAGFERVQAPANTDTEHPAIPDSNSTALTLGVGYAPSPQLDVSVGYKLAILDTITTTGTEVFPGTYNTTAHFISAGISYRFGGSSPSTDTRVASK